MKGSGFFKQKNRICKRLECFQKFLGFNNDEFKNNYNDIYSDELELKREGKDPSKVYYNRKILPLSCLIKRTSFLLISITCLIWIAIYHRKYIMPQSVLKILVLLEQQQVWLIWYYMLIFCWYGWKSEAVKVHVSFHYWKRSLGNTLKSIIS